MGTDTKTIVLIGGGGHAIVVARAAERAGIIVRAFLDDDTDAALATGDRAPERAGGFAELDGVEDQSVHLAVGNLPVRRELLCMLEQSGLTQMTIVDPAAMVMSDATIGTGTFIAAGAIVQARARIAGSCIINTGAIVEHECTLEENVHVAPGAVLAGRVRVGCDTLVGLGACVLAGVTIGCGCTVGAGAVVTGDVEDGTRVAGVPARVLGSV